MEVVASLSQGRTAAAQCGLFTHKSVPVIFEPPCTNRTESNILKEWTTLDFRNTPSTTNLEEGEIVDAPRNDGKAPMPKQVKRLNPWRKMMKSPLFH